MMVQRIYGPEFHAKILNYFFYKFWYRLEIKLARVFYLMKIIWWPQEITFQMQKFWGLSGFLYLPSSTGLYFRTAASFSGQLLLIVWRLTRCWCARSLWSKDTATLKKWRIIFKTSLKVFPWCPYHIVKNIINQKKLSWHPKQDYWPFLFKHKSPLPPKSFMAIRFWQWKQDIPVSYRFSQWLILIVKF